MGQQQLILLVLATIIVGLAIIVGIRAYTENSNKAAVDAMMQDATRIANDAQSWVKRPVAMGGAAFNATAPFTGITFDKLGYPTTSGSYVNTNGTYAVSGTPGASFLITGTAIEDTDNKVAVIVCGLSDADILGAITGIDGGATSAAPTCP